jgi:hypothetical protein
MIQYDNTIGWTLGGAVQETMDIYVTAATFKEIERVSFNITEAGVGELGSNSDIYGNHTDIPLPCQC